MASLFDMLAHNNDAMREMSKRFGLTEQQTQAALEALMPAFSQGLKRNAADPYGIGDFLSAISTGQHARYFEDAASAFSPQGRAEGDGILGHLFGSKEVSRAVAAQAAQATGLGQEMFKQMLPVLASMIMGGLFKQTTGQTQTGGSGGNPLAELMEQMMRQGMGGARAPTSQNPLDNPFGQVLESMFGGARQQAPQGGSGPLDNPLGRIFEQMMGGAQQPRAKPAPKPKTNPSGRTRNPYDDLFGDMFEAGAKTRDDYQKNMESVFDRFVKGMDKHR